MPTESPRSRVSHRRTAGGGDHSSRLCHPGHRRAHGPTGLRTRADRARAAGDLGEDWSVSDVTVRTLRSPWPGTVRMPSWLLADAPPGLRRAAGRVIYRGHDLVHRFDLRLPPAPGPEVLTIHDVVSLALRRRGPRPAGRGRHRPPGGGRRVPIAVLRRRGGLASWGWAHRRHPQRSRPTVLRRHRARPRIGWPPSASAHRSSCTPAGAPSARTWPVWPRPGRWFGRSDQTSSWC